MKHSVLPTVVLAAALMSGGLNAQNPTPAEPDSGASAPMRPFRQRPGQGPGMMGGGQRIEQLRAMIEERFAQRVKTELALDDPQMERLRAAWRADRDRRLHLNDREMDLRGAINEQMKPGVAANQDSLSRLQDALVQNHLARAQSEQQFQRDLAQFLSPVQRTRLQYMQQMLMQRIQTIREGRWRPQAGRRPGVQGPSPADPGPGPE